MRRLVDRVAVITGATRGIGLATARQFALEGARVFITGRGEEALADAVEAIGAQARGVLGDASNLDDLDRLFDVVRTEAGRVDILVANAATGFLARLGEITEEQIDRTFALNVKGTVFLVQKALPLLSAGASVILLGSAAGSTGTEAFSVYSASKAAIRNLARTWVLDLKGRSIRVNVLSPGATETPGLLGLAGPSLDERQSFLGSLAAEVPLGRVAAAEEVARVAAFLASDDASFVNGAEIFVDGGFAQI